jgi:hypothetical protein
MGLFGHYAHPGHCTPSLGVTGENQATKAQCTAVTEVPTYPSQYPLPHLLYPEFTGIIKNYFQHSPYTTINLINMFL